jgi:hypothetical protein
MPRTDADRCRMLDAQRTRNQASAIEAELAAVRGRLAEFALRSRRLTKPDQELRAQLDDRRQFLEAELADLVAPGSALGAPPRSSAQSTPTCSTAPRWNS